MSRRVWEEPTNVTTRGLKLKRLRREALNEK